MATQTCDRVITGRNFDYASALTIIQDEEYLEDEDFDDIRLIHRQGEVIQAIDKFEEKIQVRRSLYNLDSNLMNKYVLEIPTSQVFLGADAQLLWTSLAGSRMPMSICIKSSLKLNIRSLALPCSAPC